ncbi:MAG: YhcH/YjgK/YiaL family protein [Patescibacteria group bacterium]
MEQEIILKQDQIKEIGISFPEVGPFGKELMANLEKSAIVNSTVTFKDKAKQAELHEAYTDIFIILEGSEEIFIGGEIIEKEEENKGEWRGKGLINNRSYKVATGDIIIIPKGIAHQHGEGVLKMIVLKIA